MRTKIAKTPLRIAFIAAAIVCVASWAHADPISECDRLAANPSDLMRPASIAGVLHSDLDAPAAIFACEKALLQAGAPIRIGYQLGRAYSILGNREKAREHLLPAANAGYVRAIYQMGTTYWDDDENPDGDPKLAMPWFQKAADLGDSNGQYTVATFYYRGLGVPEDLTKALFWYKKAAAQGDADAQELADTIEEEMKAQ